jgi:hypothetical protein
VTATLALAVAVSRVKMHSKGSPSLSPRCFASEKGPSGMVLLRVEEREVELGLLLK